ncbi:MAG: hypothetical protein ACRYHA_14395 [Janthinobacterium lividum]
MNTLPGDVALQSRSRRSLPACRVGHSLAKLIENHIDRFASAANFIGQRDQAVQPVIDQR